MLKQIRGLFLILLIISFVLTFNACESSDEGDSPGKTSFGPITTLQLDTTYSNLSSKAGIFPYAGETYHIFTTTDAGNYTISLTGLTTDCDFAVFLYDSSNYVEDQMYIGEAADYFDLTSESETLYLSSSTTYLIVVFNYDSDSGLYTVRVDKL